MTDSWRMAITATRHCLTGCAIGEIAGMVLSTWWGWGNTANIVLSIVLAFFFGYSSPTPAYAARVATAGRRSRRRSRATRSRS